MTTAFPRLATRVCLAALLMYAAPARSQAGSGKDGAAAGPSAVLPYGLLWLEIDPPDAEVGLDGLFLDAGVWLISLAPGPHSLTLRKPGYRPLEQTIDIRRGESLSLALRLEPD